MSARKPASHIYTATLTHLTQTLKNIAQPFVTLISPSLFYAAPHIRCILQITYPELEAEEPRALHNQRQLAEPFIYLFIHLFINLSFCHHAKSNTDFMFQVACFHLDFCVSSVYYLLYIACSSAPSKNYPPCTFKSKCLTLICIQFIHICFSSTSLINFASLLDNLDQMLLNKATIDPGAHFTDGTD
jgi:hypothetical protein